MARGVVHADLVVPETERRRVVEVVDRRRLLHPDPEHQSLSDGMLVEGQVVAVQVDRRTGRSPGAAHAREVIHVGVGQEDGLDLEPMRPDEVEQLLYLVARVDQDPFAGPLTAEHEAVLVEGWRGAGVEDHVEVYGSSSKPYHNHPDVVLALVDDLLFRSRIATAAAQLGVALEFVRTPAGLIERARAVRPGLIVIDLNVRTGDPVPVVAALKADPDLGGIRTVGFVSHVQADLIARARAAGLDEVLARSAFAARLGEILAPSSRAHPARTETGEAAESTE